MSGLSISRPGALAVLASSNRKLGLCSATYVSQGSCPKGCRFLGTACYAEQGPTGIITRRLGAQGKAEGLSALDLAYAEAECLGDLPALLDLRLHVVGDCVSRRAVRIVAAKAAKWPARGRSAWGYTHSDKARRSDWGPVSVLGSVETLAGLRSVRRRGFVPALTVERFPARTWRAGGVRWVACPYQTVGTQCVECRLCLTDSDLRNKGLGIAFAVHGSGARRISLPMLGATA